MRCPYFPFTAMSRVTFHRRVDNRGKAQAPRKSLYQIPDCRFQISERGYVVRGLDCDSAVGHHETMSPSRSGGINDLMSGDGGRVITSSFPMTWMMRLRRHWRRLG